MSINTKNPNRPADDPDRLFAAYFQDQLPARGRPAPARGRRRPSPPPPGGRRPGGEKPVGPGGVGGAADRRLLVPVRAGARREGEAGLQPRGRHGGRDPPQGDGQEPGRRCRKCPPVEKTQRPRRTRTGRRGRGRFAAVDMSPGPADHPAWPPNPIQPSPPRPLADWVADAGRRTLALVADLADGQLLGPRLATVNPPLWELGHVAWFQENVGAARLPAAAPAPGRRRRALRLGRGRPRDALGPAVAVARRDARLPRARCASGCSTRSTAGRAADEALLRPLAVFHEDMHGEAFVYTRQTLGYPRAARVGPARSRERGGGPAARRRRGPRRHVPARRRAGRAVRLRQREVGPPGRAARRSPSRARR